MIILNEKEYAEECLKNKSIGDKPFFTLSILAKYYYYCFGYRKAKITELLTDFISKYYPLYAYNKMIWDETIEKIAKNAGKYTLHEIDGIWITEAELETIANIHNKSLERLAFTLLCLAKLGNMKNSNNNGWVNNDNKEIFSLARISCSANDRCAKLNKLNGLSLLEFPKRIDNLSCRVTYINDDSDKKLFISDFRELGREYLKYRGANFIYCGECGRLIRNNKYGNKKYCSECTGYQHKNIKSMVCIDCGAKFEIPGNNKRTVRCSECQTKHIREYDRIRKQK